MSNVLVFAEYQHNKFPKTTLVAVRAGQIIAEKSGGECGGDEGVASALHTGLASRVGSSGEWFVTSTDALSAQNMRPLTKDQHFGGARRARYGL